LVEGFEHRVAYLDTAHQRELLIRVKEVLEAAPLYRPTMPNSGKPFSVRMSNCGPLGWVSSKDGGYRYQATHPETGAAWPPMPAILREVWDNVAGYEAAPEACLINWYEPGSKLGLHVDADEQDTAAPVVSVSLGDDAWFRVGGRKRRDPSERVLLKSGDVVVLGGPARLAYHGVDRILANTCDLLAVAGRFNLTMRRVKPPTS
jgi:alkylated DNA repair protein (DNA oxidative demethylase)